MPERDLATSRGAQQHVIAWVSILVRPWRRCRRVLRRRRPSLNEKAFDLSHSGAGRVVRCPDSTSRRLALRRSRQRAASSAEFEAGREVMLLLDGSFPSAAGAGDVCSGSGGPRISLCFRPRCRVYRRPHTRPRRSLQTCRGRPGLRRVERETGRRTAADRVYIFAADDTAHQLGGGQGVIRAWKSNVTGIPTSFSEVDAADRPVAAGAADAPERVDARLDGLGSRPPGLRGRDDQ